MSNSFFQLPGDVRTNYRQGFAGDPVSGHRPEDAVSLWNDLGGATQVSTVVVDTATNNATYTFEVNGVAISFTADASATKPEISAGLLLALQNEPLVSAVVSGVDDGVDTLTLTARTPGADGSFTITDSDTRLTTTTTTAASAAEAIPFGRAVVTPSLTAANGLVASGGLAGDGKFSAQVATISFVYSNGKTLRAVVTNMHTKKVIADAEITQATDAATSGGLLVTALNALLPANSALAAGTTSPTLTAEEEGFEFRVEVFSDDQTNVPSVADTTGPSPATSLLRSFQGISLRRLDEEYTSASSGTIEYPANAGFTALRKGQIYVAIDAGVTIAYGDAAYVELDDSGSNAGRIYNASSATRVKLPGAQFIRQSETTEDNVAVLEFDADYVRNYAI